MALLIDFGAKRRCGRSAKEMSIVNTRTKLPPPRTSSASLTSPPSSHREAARAAPLLGNQLHHADIDLNPGAILPEGGGDRFASDVRKLHFVN